MVRGGIPDNGLLSTNNRTGEPVPWQLHTGCGKKMGESYVYSRSTFNGGGNKKSGEIKPDG